MKYLFIIILSSTLICAQTSNTTIEKLQKKFDSLTNFQADFIQLSNSEEGLSGRFYFAQKEKYRIELTNNIIISNGTTIWNLDKNREKVIISNIEDDPLSFSLREYIFNYPENCTVTEKKIQNGEILVTLKALNTDLNFDTAELYVTNDDLISKIEVKDFNGNSFGFIFKNTEVNKNINNSLFEFNENGDYKIIDLR